MKKTIFLPIIFLCSLTLNAKNNPDLKSNNEGMLWFKYMVVDGYKVQYVVDTVCQVCYCKLVEGITEIPCKKLKKRPEWKEVITWEE
ncbi:MAG: hypothetical protein JXA96_01130 [Sedimentisphaerales bacterium]|nr:hypothetical protein [Sedimentisphaerales bacterium]